MLSFKHRSGVYFQQPIEAQQLNQRATCALQIPSSAIPDSNIKARERYLIALAVDYLCRWRVAVGATDSASVVTDDEATHIAAFYSAIEHLEERNRHELVVGAAAPALDKCSSAAKAAAETAAVQEEDCELIESKSKCCGDKRLHDWSMDAAEKQYFSIKGRPHVLVHFVHPCNFGAQLVHIDSAAGTAGGAASLSDSVGGHGRGGGGVRAPSRDARNALMNEMLSKVSDMRKRTDGTKVSNQVEEQRSLRTEAADAQRRRESSLKAHLHARDMQACNKMIQRARAITPDYSEEDEEDEEEEDDTYEEEASELDGQAANDDDDEDESDTFSDEEEQEEKEESSEEEELAVAETPASASNIAGNSTTATAEETAVEPAATAKEKKKACRQTTVEMMVGVCEPSDSIAFFDELELPYIVQWAAESGSEGEEVDQQQPKRRKLHLFRKTTRQVRGWVYNSTRNAYHWLGTIEALI